MGRQSMEVCGQTPEKEINKTQSGSRMKELTSQSRAK